jgi:hypothetical protein
MKPPLLLALALAVPAAGLAAQHPTFAGNWTLDVAHSDAGPAPLTSGTYAIVVRGDTLTIDRVLVSEAGPSASHLVLGIDGKPWVNTISSQGQSVQLTSVASWAHDTLVIQSTGNVMGTDATITDRWAPSADGQSFTATRNIVADGQEVPGTRLVYIRKP